jgi:hypothetical protein
VAVRRVLFAATLLSVLAVGSSHGAEVATAAAPSVHIVPDPLVAGVGSAGNTFTVEVSDSVEGSAGFYLVADYDEDIIDVVATLNASPLIAPLCLENPDHEIGTGPDSNIGLELGCAALTPSSGTLPSGSVPLASIVFNCLSPGTSTITFVQSFLLDVNFTEIPTSSTFGIVTCEPRPSLRLSPSTAAFPTGSFENDVALRVTEVPELAGYEIEATYDPSVIEITGLADQSGLATSSCEQLSADPPGAIMATCVSSPPVSIVGPTIDLVMLTFSCLSTGTTAVSFTHAAILDTNLDPTPLVPVTGHVKCTAIEPETTLSIDADPSNGNGPCNPIDNSRQAVRGDVYDVAICTENMPPPTSLDLTLRHDHTKSTRTPNPGNSPDHLDGNPDINEGPGPGAVGSGWQCGPADIEPSSGEANISCAAGTSELISSPGLLALVEFTSNGTGPESLFFDQAVTAISGTVCGITFVCRGATIIHRPQPDSGCKLVIGGAAAADGHGYFTGLYWPTAASVTIPAGADNATIQLVGVGTPRERTFVGSPGQSFTFGFPIRWSDESVRCLVDGETRTISSLDLRVPNGVAFVTSEATGAPVPRAAVRLEADSDVGSGEAWVELDPFTQAFSPGFNPQLTGLDGRYAWSVTPVYPQPVPAPTNDFRVFTSAVGCAPEYSPAQTAPPPFAVNVALVCRDTDGDGLEDFVEFEFGLSPTVDDSDGNGLTDDLDDLDHDGVANAVEVLKSANLISVDSDSDGLTDDLELGAGTSLLVNDTDLDYCSDAQELANQASAREPDDPLNRSDFPNTDGNDNIGFGDFLTLLAAWNTTPNSGFWDPRADFDDTLIVGFSDFIALLASWNRTCV